MLILLIPNLINTIILINSNNNHTGNGWANISQKLFLNQCVIIYGIFNTLHMKTAWSVMQCNAKRFCFNISIYLL